MKVVLEIEYPNDKIFAAGTLPIRIVDLNYGIYFEGKAKVVPAIPIEWIKEWCNIEHKSCEERLMLRYGVITMLEDWEKENEIDRP